ncbi:MAG: serine/threonine protein kinase [Xanthobacteraceae bacterium]|nr:serine/threonine protein kinase [Xanthobacteraceae bacterium]QYK43968.1 MAG: serine/threonine protein kinase [Xanthobacteraceae bacterium]
MSRQFFSTLPPGTLIAGYEIVRPLGQGGFGITYEAYNKIAKRRVAIKEFFPSALASRDGATQVVFFGKDDSVFRSALDRFEKSTSALADLQHKNILDVLNYVSAHGTGYMIMELVDGDTFLDWLRNKESGMPEIGELQSILEPVCDALEYVHARNTLHRDVAPDNIMIRKNGQPVLIDFGAMKVIESDTRLKLGSAEHAISSQITFKPNYSSPEQVAGKALDASSDVYSLAAVLYRAVTGRPPEDAMKRRNNLIDGEGDPYVPVREKNPDVPQALASAIDRALTLRREDRMATVSELRAALMSVKGDDGGETIPGVKKKIPQQETPPPPPPATPERIVSGGNGLPPQGSGMPPSAGERRFGWPAIAAVIGAIALLLFAGVYSYREGLFSGTTRVSELPKPEPQPLPQPKPEALPPLAEGHAYCRSRHGQQSFAVEVVADKNHPFRCDCGGGFVWNDARTLCVQPKPARTIADGHPYCRSRFGEFAVAVRVNDSEANPYECGCRAEYSFNPSQTQCRLTPTLERGHAFCRQQYGNAQAVSVNHAQEQPYACSCSGNHIWNDARTYCVAPPPPRQTLANRLVAGGRWAVSGNCQTPRDTYTARISGSNFIWRDGLGREYVEAIEYNGDDELRTRTINSPDPKDIGALWSYVSFGDNDISVRKNGRVVAATLRCR